LSVESAAKRSDQILLTVPNVERAWIQPKAVNVAIVPVKANADTTRNGDRARTVLPQVEKTTV